MKTVYFHKTLQKYTNNVEQHTFDVDTYFDVLQACVNLFPEFENFMRSFVDGKNKHEEIVFLVDNRVINIEEIGLPLPTDKKVTIVPLIYGSGKAARIFAIAAIFAIMVFQPQIFFTTASHFAYSGIALTSAIATGAATVTGTTILGSLAIGIAATLTISLLTPTPKFPKITNAPADTNARRNNDMFSGVTNTTSASQIIPLTYGHNRVAGQFISGFSKSLRHGKEDIISVIDQFDPDTAGDVRLIFSPEWKQDVSSVEWSPNSRFTYKVPEPKGTQPLDYTANNLPSFATFNPDANVRTISGRAPSSGRGRIEITANNSLGSSVFTLRWNVYDYQWDDQGSSGDFGEDE